jgi:TolB protein
MIGKTLLVLAGAVGVVVLAVSQAWATAPGANGQITYRTYFDLQHSWGAVYVMQPDGSGKRQISHPRRGVVDDQPSWAPDGSLIAFTRCRPELPCHVLVAPAAGGKARQLGKPCAPTARETTCPDDSDASFSPDSRRLLFVQSTGVERRDAHGDTWIQHSALMTMDKAGAHRRPIFQGRPWSGDVHLPEYSPDGKQIVFEWEHSGFVSPPNARAVFVINADGGKLRQLTPWSENSGDNPDWSPDGQWILFHTYVDEPLQSQFFIIHPDGTGRRQITHFAEGTHVSSAGFSPDGTKVVFSKGPEGGNIDVYVMSSDGTNEQRLTTSRLWESAPAWGPAP